MKYTPAVYLYIGPEIDTNPASRHFCRCACTLRNRGHADPLYRSDDYRNLTGKPDSSRDQQHAPFPAYRRPIHPQLARSTLVTYRRTSLSSNSLSACSACSAVTVLILTPYAVTPRFHSFFLRVLCILRLLFLSSGLARVSSPVLSPCTRRSRPYIDFHIPRNWIRAWIQCS